MESEAILKTAATVHAVHFDSAFDLFTHFQEEIRKKIEQEYRHVQGRLQWKVTLFNAIPAQLLTDALLSINFSFYPQSGQVKRVDFPSEILIRGHYDFYLQSTLGTRMSINDIMLKIRNFFQQF